MMFTRTTPTNKDLQLGAGLSKLPDLSDTYTPRSPWCKFLAAIPTPSYHVTKDSRHSYTRQTTFKTTAQTTAGLIEVGGKVDEAPLPYTLAPTPFRRGTRCSGSSPGIKNQLPNHPWLAEFGLAEALLTCLYQHHYHLRYPNNAI